VHPFCDLSAAWKLYQLHSREADYHLLEVMKIAFYCPMKPIDHVLPSGDRLIARNLYEYLKINGHEPFILSDLRTLFFHKKTTKYLLFYLPYHFLKLLIVVLMKKPDIFYRIM